MSTECELQLFCPKTKADDCAKAILKEAKRIEKKYNYYDLNSVLSKINQREITQLDLETKTLLQQAQRYYFDTQKIFDITIATIKNCYMEKSRKGMEDCIKRLQKYIGCENFVIKKNKIHFNNVFTKIDLGGFAKEYAVDRALLEVKKRKISSAIINFGGDIYIHGTKQNREKFKIGIKDPKNPNNFIKFLELSNCAVTTSAHYERSTIIEERSYSHIISTTIFSKNLSTTVIAPSTIEAGVYSTALSINNCLLNPYETIFIY
jgi:thiamine biosynthesis lipoprotein